MNFKKVILLYLLLISVQNLFAAKNDYTNALKLDEKIDMKNFKKVSLKNVILETLSLSNVLKASQETVIQSRIAYEDANAAYLPTLDFTYTQSKSQRRGLIDTADLSIRKKTYDDKGYKLILKQSLYSGGTTKLDIKAAKDKYEEAKRAHSIKLDIEMQKAIKAYFDVLFDNKKLNVSLKNMEKLIKILEITQVKYDSGALALGDIAAVKANVANSQSQLTQIKSSLANSKDYYIYLLGDGYKETLPYQTSFDIILDSLTIFEEEIMENNMILKNLRLNIQAKKDAISKLKYGFKPTIDLEVAYNKTLDEEDFVEAGEKYSAKVTLKYNLYNAGKDTNKVLTSYSSLQELKFTYQEEIKKLQWGTSKLYNTVTSLRETLKSTENEISASNEMVDNYWEGFQLGEQDLTILLQAQRQLNAAEIELLKHNHDYITNLFKTLTQKSKLAQYFDINPYSKDFINFAKSDIIEESLKLDLSKDGQKNKLAKKTLTKTIDTYLEINNEANFEDLISFKDNFLESTNNKYTILISSFTNNYNAYKYIDEKRILKDSFSYGLIDSNGTLVSPTDRTKKFTVKTNIVHGIFANKKSALNNINNFFDNDKTDKNFQVVKVSSIKKQYKKYIAGLQARIDPYVILPVTQKIFRTNDAFRESFLNAQKYFFTINIGSVTSMNQAESLLNKYDIVSNSFVFKYGRNGEWIKVMMGVFETYSDALETLQKYPNLNELYNPIIERIGHKQELHEKYAKFNIVKKVETKIVPIKMSDLIEDEKDKKKAKNTYYKEQKKQKYLKPKDVKIIDKSKDIVKKIVPIVSKLKPIHKPKPLIIASVKKQEIINENKIVRKILKEKILDEKVIQSDKMIALSNEIITKKKTNVVKTAPLSIYNNEATYSKKELVKKVIPKEITKGIIEKLEPLLSENKVLPVVKAKTKNIYAKEEVFNIKENSHKKIEEVVKIIDTKELENDIINATRYTSKTQEKLIKVPKVLENKRYDSPELNKEVVIPADVTQEEFQRILFASSKEKYTIKMSTINNNKLNAFLAQYLLTQNYALKKEKKKTTIYFGIYNTLTEAKEAILNLHPRIMKSTQITQIKSIK